MPPIARLVTAMLVFSSSTALIQASSLPAPVVVSTSPTPQALLMDNDAQIPPMTPEEEHTAAKHFFEKRGAGSIVKSCYLENSIAITFDDGPFDFTNDLLDTLDRENVKVTFFLNGKNVGSIYDYPGIIKRAYRSGHQIGSHTWDHVDLSTVSLDEVADQMNRCKVPQIPGFLGRKKIISFWMQRKEHGRKVKKKNVFVSNCLSLFLGKWTIISRAFWGSAPCLCAHPLEP